MRGLNVCVLGPAALILTAVVIALTPMVGNAAQPDAADAAVATSGGAHLAAGDSSCDVSDAAITWGVKESLRSYISGTIANGEWAVSDGATYETPNFGWSDGTGTIDAGRGTLAFDGNIRFTGHDGILNTTLGGFEIVVDGSTTAHIIFDVSGTTQDGTPVDETGVTFADIDTSGLTVADGTATLNAAPVTLTEAGSAAFGTYPAGEKLDPITVSFSATSDCMPAPQAASDILTRTIIIVAGVVVAIAVGAGILITVIRRRAKARTRNQQ